MGKYRVLIVNRSLDAGGVEAFIHNTVTHLNPELFDVTVTIFDKEPGEVAYYEKGIQDCGASVIKLFAGRNKYLQYIERRRLLGRHLKKNVYDVVHINGCFSDDGVDCWVAHRHGVPNIIMHAHTADVQWKKNDWRHFLTHYLAKLCPLANRYATNLCACSEEAARWMYGATEVRGKKVHIVPNGIDYARFAYREDVRGAMREKLGLHDRLVVGTVGRLADAKNQVFLVDVFAEIRKTRPDAFLLILGEGPCERAIRDRVKELKVEDHFRLLDSTWSAAECLQAMDAFVMPSIYEGFGIACVEAQAAGLPTFVSDKVTQAVVISATAWRISLNESGARWAETILEHAPNEGRRDSAAGISDFRLNIANSVKQIESIYMNRGPATARGDTVSL